MSGKRPVVMIGLDGAAGDRVLRLCQEGKMPTLDHLYRTGYSSILEGPAGLFAGGVWPTFYTGKEVPSHGLFHNKLWRPEAMRCEMANETWLPEKPFWERLNRENLRTAVLDVPMTVAPPKPNGGLQLAGWNTHDLLCKGAWPPALWKQLARQFGSPAVPPELFGPQTPKTLLRLRKQLLQATTQIGAIGESILRKEAWDLFLLVFGSPHRAGHYLYDLSQIDTLNLGQKDLTLLHNSLDDIYIACDKALARLLRHVPPEATTMVFAVHGMGKNPGWADRCGEILARIQNADSTPSRKTGLLYRLKKALPWQVIRQVTTRLPQAVQHRLVSLWSASMCDWETTRLFPLPMDHAGYLRVNLRGREPRGIVSSGREHEELLLQTAEAIGSFRDMDTGKPIASRIFTLPELGPEDAPYRDLLPDLVITWGEVPASSCRGIRSESFGEILWEDAGRLPSGRAGNHTEHGWFVATGPGVSPGKSSNGHRITDLVPTLDALLDVKSPEDLQGLPIEAVCGPVGKNDE